jgi:cyclic pyranopterin phosphate synthase
LLEDNFGRRFYYLRLSITEACNFRCQYCLPDGYKGRNDGFLSADEISTVTAAFAGLGTSKIRITGGEPSLRRDLPDIIARCANTPGIRKVAMTTHGARLAKLVDQWSDAGLHQVNVSIDSLDPNQFALMTGYDRLSEIIDGVEGAVERGMLVKVNAILMKGYQDTQLHSFLQWLKKTPITLRFIELMETGDHSAFYQRFHVSGQPLKEQLLASGWQPVLRTKDAGPAEEFTHPDYLGRIGLIMPYSPDFCKQCNRLRISALGKLHLCLFSEQGLDLRSLIQSGDVQALQQHLRELMSGKHATHYLHDGKTGATSHLAMLGG